MIKDRLKYIAAAAFGAGAVLLATGTGTHLIAFQGSNVGTVRAHASDDRVQLSPTPEASQSPEPMPDVLAPVTVPVAAPKPDDETNEAVEDAQDANEAAEPADVDANDVNDATDVNDENPLVPVPLGQPVADDHGHDGKASGGSGSDDHGTGGHGSDDGLGG